MSPYYPAYFNALKALGIKVVVLEGDIDNSYQPTVSILKNYSNLKGLIIASPANPTGSIIHKSNMLGISKWCSKNKRRRQSNKRIQYMGYLYT